MARPRDPEIADRAVAAARTLLEQGGPGAVTMEAVAAAAGVGKSALYRRWASSAHLLFEVSTSTGVPSPMPDLGSFRADLAAAIDSMVRSMEVTDRGVVATQLGAMIVDADFARRVYGEQLGPDLARVKQIWDRAVERGEIRAGLDGTAALNDVVGAFVYRVMILHESPDEAMVADVVDRVVDGVVGCSS